MNKYKTAKHSGGLKECLETETEISQNTAMILIQSGIYVFYAYDERIKAYRYILTDKTKDLGLPTWIHVYGDKI